ncbi:hypothetical protein CCAND95_90005 [Capnocytophaga canis]|nr:hypothetical protein CCAND95_90005 [Capnocytophaga canis]
MGIEENTSNEKNIKKKSFYLYFNNKNLNHVITMLKKYHINKIVLFLLCYLCHYFLII